MPHREQGPSAPDPTPDPTPDPAPEPQQPSPEALRMNAIVKRALEGAVEAFNIGLIEGGLAPLDDSYELVAQLEFRRRIESDSIGGGRPGDG